jgi:hypothetical protein
VADTLTLEMYVWFSSIIWIGSQYIDDLFMQGYASLQNLMYVLATGDTENAFLSFLYLWWACVQRKLAPPTVNFGPFGPSDIPGYDVIRGVFHDNPAVAFAGTLILYCIAIRSLGKML